MDPGYDLLGAFVGSEGTLGIATKITVRLTARARGGHTLLAAFESIEQGGAGGVGDHRRGHRARPRSR